MLKMLLTRQGISSELAHNGAEAVEAVKARGGLYDVIFMDHTMPVKVRTYLHTYMHACML
jgi:CheY-like chemotaxis protein